MESNVKSFDPEHMYISDLFQFFAKQAAEVMCGEVQISEFAYEPYCFPLLSKLHRI